MRVDKNQSHGSPEFLAFAEALVNLVRVEQQDLLQKEALDFACRNIWPGCDIYRGGTHWRVMPSVSLGSTKSFYVDFSTEPERCLECGQILVQGFCLNLGCKQTDLNPAIRGCFSCGDNSTPFYCLNCASEHGWVLEYVGKKYGITPAARPAPGV